MTDTNAPERIWIYRNVGDHGWQGGGWRLFDAKGMFGPMPAYIRADLATPAPREDGYSAGVRAALEAAARLAEQGMMSVDGGQARAEILSLAGALLDAPALPDARAGAVEPPFSFDRYINGQLMAEGVTIERQPTLALAMAAAARIASKGLNGEIPVLVYAPPTPACTATDGPASACVYRAPGLGTAATFEKG